MQRQLADRWARARYFGSFDSALAGFLTEFTHPCTLRARGVLSWKLPLTAC